MAGVLALALVAGVMGQGAWRTAYIAMAMHHKSALVLGTARGESAYSSELAGLAWQGFVSDLGRACLLGLLVVGIAWFARRGRLPALIATAGVLVLLLVDLWPVSGRVMAPVIGDRASRDLNAGRDDVVDFLEKAGPPGTFRVLPLDEFQTNRFAGFGVASLGGYHAAKPRLFQDFMDADLRGNMEWLRLLNIRYFVVHYDYQEPPGFLRPVFRGSAYVYENLDVMPRATLVGCYAVVQPARAILDSVRLMQRDASVCTFLEQDPGLTLGPVEGGRARIASYRLNDVTVDVDTPGPALLRLADLWQPDWTARVDGTPAPVLKADYLLRAVPVPAGRHRVVFRYEPQSVRQGLLVSFLSLALVLAGFVLSWWMRPKGPGSAGKALRPEAGQEAA